MRHLMQKIVDLIMPHNCRQALKHAAELNKSVADDALALLINNPQKIIAELKSDRRNTPR